MYAHFNPFLTGKILEASELKEFADGNSKLDENGREFSKWGENAVRKGEIGR